MSSSIQPRRISPWRTPALLRACAFAVCLALSASLAGNAQNKNIDPGLTAHEWGTFTTVAGETGQAVWRTLNIGDLRVRQVEYSAGYLADHWCDREHVLYVLEGELDTELRDGRRLSRSRPLGNRCSTSPSALK